MNARDELLTRARNLERYPFESATMAEAGRLAAQHLREAVRDMHTNGQESVQAVETCTAELVAALAALVDQDGRYRGNDIIISCDSHADAIGRIRKARAALERARDSDGTATAAANGDLPVPHQDCQARAESIAQPQAGDSHDR